MLGLAALTGGMLFFGALMAPLIFTQLPLVIAGPFIRSVFPFYYAYIIVSATIGACGFILLRQRYSALVLFAVITLTGWLWFWLIPHLDIMRIAGDHAAFNRGHTLSVWLNGAEFITAFVLLLRLA